MENYCCWDDLLPLLKNPRGDCCSTLEEIREVVRRHREEPIRSIGGGMVFLNRPSSLAFERGNPAGGPLFARRPTG